jgi:hypothetical protein
MYDAWIMLFRRYHDDWTSGAIPHDKVFIVRYDRMMKDFDGLMDDMCEFLDHDMSPELRKTIAEKADKQRAYKSKHKYDLAKFGLDEEKIRKDCAFVYETFLPEVDWEAERAKRAASGDNGVDHDAPTAAPVEPPRADPGAETEVGDEGGDKATA